MRHTWWRLLVFVAAASVPAFWLYRGVTAALGPDPGKVLVDNLGQGALVLLLCSLAMTPLQRLSGWAGWMAVRRQLGLWSFAYGTLHLIGFSYFLLGLDFGALPAELRDRPYIAVGFVGYLGLLALACTSTRASMRWLGKRWKRLHSLIYPILLVVLLHMLWVVRSDLGQWALYAVIGVVLLSLRTPPGKRLLEKLKATRH